MLNQSSQPEQPVNPDDFIITRKRKLYKFAVFQNMTNCYDDRSWSNVKKEIVNNGQPLTIEVGAGTALFLTELARQHPDQRFIAIDRKSDRLYKGAKLANELGLTNIVYLWSNARNLASLLPNGSVSEIWLTFPDPWPQESNIKHRLTNPKFLEQYHKLLKADGVLNFKTDNRPLFDWSAQQFDNNQWHITHLTHNLHSDNAVDDDAKIMTTYEERYVGEGKPINYLRAQKLIGTTDAGITQ